MTMPCLSQALGLAIPHAKARHTERKVLHCIQGSCRLLPSRPAVVAESTCIFVALAKLQGRIFVNEISALASDAPNVSSVATRVAEQSRRPGMARKHVCRRSRDIHEHLRAGLRLYAFWQFL